MIKRIMSVVIILLLCGCARTTATDSIVESVGKNIDALEQTLTPECKTPAVMAELNAIKAVAETLPAVCEQEKDTIREERNKWKVAFFAAAALLVFVLTKRFI